MCSIFLVLYFVFVVYVFEKKNTPPVIKAETKYLLNKTARQISVTIVLSKSVRCPGIRKWNSILNDFIHGEDRILNPLGI